MNAQVDLYIADTRIPLSGSVGIRLSKAASEIREPEKRSGSWSRTIQVPGSKEIHKLLGHIFEVHHRIQGDPSASENFDPDFNPNLKAQARLLVDGCEALRGYARLLEIKRIPGGSIQYEIQLAGETKGLFQILEGKRMRDLDFSDLYHTLSRTNIANSWDTSYQRGGSAQTFTYGEGYVYPILDQGGNTLSRKFPISDMYPALALREIVAKIFEGAGYTWTGDSFFEGSFFKHLYHLHHGGSAGLSEADLLAKEWKAGRAGSDLSLGYGDTLILNDDSSTGFYDPQGGFNTSTGIWTLTTAGLYQLSVNLEASVQFTSGGGDFSPAFMVFVNGKQREDLVGYTYWKSPISQTISIRSSTFPLDLVPGDQVEIKFYGFMDKNWVLIPETEVVSFQIKKDTSLGFVELQARTHQAGDTFDFSTFFSGERTQRDFLLDLFRAFNLLVRPSGSADRELVIKTEKDFYSSTIKDWSKKIDLSQEIQLIPMGDLQDQIYRFTWKPSPDISNKSYQDRYLEAFGSYQYKVNNDFVRSSREIQLGFTLTPSINYGSAWNAVLPHIEYQDGKQQGSDRFLYYGGLRACQAFQLLDGTGSGAASSTYNAYPFFGHVDDPIQPTLDLCFGMPREVALALDPGTLYTNNNLFNQYWRPRLDLIADPNSKILRAQFRLTAADWEALDLSELIYCENEYWRINKVEDWDPLADGMCTVELIRSKTAASFTPSTRRGWRGWDSLDPYMDLFPVLKAGDPRPGGNISPSTRGNGSGVDTLGGMANVIKRSDVMAFSSFRCVVLAENIQLLNCQDCVILPEAKGSILIRCSDLEVSEPGIYVDGVKIQQVISGGTYQADINPGTLEGAEPLTITFS